ncbi:Cof-type HAD-IIB family hydrolase [Weissella tructae]|uniref:HAD superfamily hydrolase n=2 Tax=Weissella TaxID=46255 RepID=A0A075TYK4_9LACO|nr:MULTISPECIES: Cof-type HAD-IIB family hydrolase [Weissella]AIG64998.1 HAD superfamily hydrolase [Weissella tructae]AIM62310.1 HAD superfamily hydrolase [Weissella ceti]AIM63649.1 HAD superfamily hydrolase [Weissella ceti]ELA07810.1 HAD superfamily hydrolase [Weissella ceti NC36]QVV91409.1 Cof-type HAD-IIB family hydrolase [Weissella tructae]
MIKLVTIDIDDTLVNSAKEITPRVKAAVQAATAAGVKIVLTTGRPITGVQAYLDELGLNNLEDQYVVTYNGAMIQTTAGTTIGGNPLNHAAYVKLADWAVEHDYYIQVESSAEAFTPSRKVNPAASGENYMINMPLNIVDVADMDPELAYVKFMFIEPAARLQEVRADLDKTDFAQEFTFVQSSTQFLEVLNQAASKGNALRTLAGHLNVDISETMAIGDQANDLTMIEAAGLGVAMGNAVPAIKAAAQEETTTQNEDGVGVALEKFVLA